NKSGRMDDMHSHPDAGAEPDQRAGILSDIGLIEGQIDRHRHRFLLVALRARSRLSLGKLGIVSHLSHVTAGRSGQVLVTVQKEPQLTWPLEGGWRPIPRMRVWACRLPARLRCIGRGS